MTSQDAALDNIDRLRTRIERDPILTQFVEGRKLAVGFTKIVPSGVDLVACTLAATVYGKDEGIVALAAPRGQHGLAAIVGSYLARVQQSRRNPGSVAVLTRSTSLRRAAGSLRVSLDRFGDQIQVRKLGTVLLPGGRVRPAAVSYLGSHDRKGLSQADHYLLFQLPHVAPPTAHNVISTVVVDTVASSHESWEQSWERNRRARRRQVWIGELGDPAFDAFCREREIPLFRFDWETISACASAFGCGSGPLTTAPLCNSAGGAVGPAYQVCNHGRFNEELKTLNSRLAEIRKRGKPESVEDKPAPVRAAEQLASFFGRIAFPVETFDAQTAFVYSVRSSAYLLAKVEGAYAAAFRGRAWKDAFAAHWGAVKGAAKELREIATMECPKWWAVCVRVEEAHRAGERLRIVCQTQAGQAALAQSLVDENIVPPSAIGDAIEIVTFSERDDQGNEADERVTLYLAPPPPWHASVYLTGERGRAEVLVYATQVWQLRSAFARTWIAATNHAENAATLARLGIDATPAAAAADAEPPALIELEQFTIDDTTTTEADYLDAAGNGHMHALLEEIVSLHGKDVDDDEVERRARSPRCLPGATTGTASARRITFVEGPVLIVAADASLDVVWTAGAKGAVKVIEKTPDDLVAGNRLIVLPGAKRGSLLQELMGAWDQRLGPVRFAYQSLWQAAIEAAAEKLGRPGLASRLGVTVGTVDGWLDPVKGSMWPQQRSWMREILDIARDRHEKAWENRAPIIRYIERTRGAHRVIGRLLNRAVTEAVTGSGTRWTRELEKRVGQTVEDQLAAAQFLTVKEVGPLEQLPPNQIGLFIDPDSASPKGTP